MTGLSEVIEANRGKRGEEEGIFLAVGIDVGIDVGWHRGPGSPPIAVGIDVGLDVGLAVGIDVGIAVGLDVGLDDGIDVGWMRVDTQDPSRNHDDGGRRTSDGEGEREGSA